MDDKIKNKIEQIREQLINSRNDLNKITYPISTLDRNAYQFRLSHAHEALNLSIAILTDLGLKTK